MMKLLIAASTAGLLAATAVPAAAQFYIGADPYYGAGVQVGPFGAGVGPRYGWRDHTWDDGYRAYGAADCRIVRERVVTPSGRVIVQRHRVCD